MLSQSETVFVDVTPLDESYNGTARVIHLSGAKPLAVSHEDFARITDLLGEVIEDRLVQLSTPDGHLIRITVIPS